MIKILHVVGARPNFMKIAPLLEALAEHADRFRNELVHTGQHYDERMSDLFFRDLGLPRPDYNLEVGSGTHAEQTAAIMVRFEKVVHSARPDLVVVVGDVNSTAACGLVAAKEGVKLAHVEAGLRSRDRSMPEEINRVVTDALADLHFTTCREANDNLVAEGVDPGRIHLVGNLMADTLLKHRERARHLPLLPRFGLHPGGYALVTLHRPSNVDQPAQLQEILNGLELLSRDTHVLLPMHPRTAKQLTTLAWLDRLQANRRFVITEPLGYLEFLHCMMHAGVVVTDSGGVQEETTVLGVPCLTLRKNTERAVTIEHGTNELVALHSEAIAAAGRRALTDKSRVGRVPELWDGQSARRLAAILRKLFAPA
jgi:UDP-N-acetylglucosamine 2-epimerase (non-hydrolysing)